MMLVAVAVVGLVVLGLLYTKRHRRAPIGDVMSLRWMTDHVYTSGKDGRYGHD